MKLELTGHAQGLFPITGSGRERVEFLGLAFVPWADDLDIEGLTFKRVNLQMDLRLTRADGSTEEDRFGLPVPEMAGVVSPDGKKFRVVVVEGARFVVTSDALQTWLKRSLSATAERARFRFARWAPEERTTIEALLKENYRGL